MKNFPTALNLFTSIFGLFFIVIGIIFSIYNTEFDKNFYNCNNLCVVNNYKIVDCKNDNKNTTCSSTCIVDIFSAFYNISCNSNCTLVCSPNKCITSFTVVKNCNELHNYNINPAGFYFTAAILFSITPIYLLVNLILDCKCRFSFKKTETANLNNNLDTIVEENNINFQQIESV